MNLASNTAPLPSIDAVQRRSHPADHRVADPALDIFDGLPGCSLVPVPVEVFGREAELDDQIAGEVGRPATCFRYPAIAEEDDTNRSEGEALFPHHKSLPFLMERRAAMTRAAWESEYQQNPIVVGGGIFPIEKLTTMALLDRTNILKSVRYWDKAGTEDAGAYTAGVLIHMLKDKRFVIEHVVRGRWSALEREQHIKAMGRARPRAHQGIIRDRRRAGARQRRQRIGGEHDPQPRRLQGVRRQGHGLQGGPRRAVRSSSAGRQCLAHRRPLATPIFGRARAIPERQVQGPSRRKYGRVQPARLTSELQPGRPCIMMQATASLSLELFMRARRRSRAVGLRQEVQLTPCTSSSPGTSARKWPHRWTRCTRKSFACRTRGRTSTSGV